LVTSRGAAGGEGGIEVTGQLELRTQREWRMLVVVRLAKVGGPWSRAEHATDPARPRARHADDEHAVHPAVGSLARSQPRSPGWARRSSARRWLRPRTTRCREAAARSPRAPNSAPT